MGRVSACPDVSSSTTEFAQLGKMYEIFLFASLKRIANTLLQKLYKRKTQMKTAVLMLAWLPLHLSEPRPLVLFMAEPKKQIIISIKCKQIKLFFHWIINICWNWSFNARILQLPEQENKHWFYLSKNSDAQHSVLNTEWSFTRAG